MTKNQAIELCLKFKDSYEDYPFDDNWAAIRHKTNKKTFAFIFRHNGQVKMNLKVIPELGAVWREQYKEVEEAYHMNKLHWISVILDGSLTEQFVTALVKDSYELTKPKSNTGNKK